MRGHRSLQLAACASLLCAAIALLVPFEPLRLAFAAPLALFLPGYAIAAATFARRRIEGPQFLVICLALSLSVLAIGALVLNYTPGGIRALPWAILLLLVILNGCRIAALRRPPGSTAPKLRLPSFTWVEGGLLLGGGAAAVGALVLAATIVPAREAQGFTQLWALPAPGSNGAAIEVGVESEEQGPASYYLGIRVGESPPVKRVVSLRLDPGESRVVRVSPPPPATGKADPVVATLVRQNEPTRVYRRVKNWLYGARTSR
jgi:hypothetical protein